MRRSPARYGASMKAAVQDRFNKFLRAFQAAYEARRNTVPERTMTTAEAKRDADGKVIKKVVGDTLRRVMTR
jgi:hypothetical protein